MCMGGGGKSKPAVITQPDYTAFNQQFELQKAAITSQINNTNLAMQTQLNTALQTKQDNLSMLALASQQRASAVQAAVTRLASVMGPPPREKHAKPPEIGADDRGVNVKKGKKSLRIRKTAGSGAGVKNSQGSGLNIT